MRLIQIMIFFLVFSCSKNDSGKERINSNWLVDDSEVTGQFNLFPLIENPEFTNVQNIDLANNELVGVVNFGNEIRVYPYVYINHVEVINDSYNGQKFAFTYCPLTKSAVAFKTNGIFRASGYLYKDNLTPWDEESESIWSQMLLKGIRGENSNSKFQTIPVLETTFATIKNYLPSAKVLTFNSTISRSAAPPDGQDSDEQNAPENGDLVYGIINDFSEVDVFNFKDFSSPQLLKIQKGTQDYIVYGNESKHIISAFKVQNFDNFQVIEDDFPNILKDNNGLSYDIFGRASNGNQLIRPKNAYVAIWRAWDDFFDSFTFHNQ